MTNYMLQPNVRLTVEIMEVLHEHEKEKETDGSGCCTTGLDFIVLVNLATYAPGTGQYEVLRADDVCTWELSQFTTDPTYIVLLLSHSVQ